MRDFQRKVLESVLVALELARLRGVWQSGLFEKKIVFFVIISETTGSSVSNLTP